MKKILYAAIAAASAMLICSCQPQVLVGGTPDKPITDSQLSSAFVITGQFADINCTTPQTDGNFIQYTTNPATTVQIITVKNDVETILTAGPSGVFKIYPKRKSNPVQPFKVRAMNQDGSTVTVDKTATVFVPTELDPELKLLLGKDGKKAWTWNTDCVCGGKGWFYGEGGNTGSGSDFSAIDFDGAWWGAYDTDHLKEYADVTGVGVIPDMDEDAYMIFDEEGVVGYTPDGNPIVYTVDGKTVKREGTYEITDYDPEHKKDAWQIGKFTTSAPAILLPYCIHEEGVEETEFQLVYLDENYMTLVDPESSEAGDWDNITYWMFKVKK